METGCSHYRSKMPHMGSLKIDRNVSAKVLESGLFKIKSLTDLLSGREKLVFWYMDSSFLVST